MKKTLLIGLLILLLLSALPLQAQDQIIVYSQPDRVAIFLNNIAFVEDSITLPGHTSIQIALPPQVYPDTIILMENGDRVPHYRLSQQDGYPMLQWESSAADTTIVSLSYLMSGLSWKPTYDLDIRDGESSEVDLDFFAEIQNGALDLADTEVRLVAGRVDTSQQLDAVSHPTTNQIIVGYEEVDSAAGAPVGAVTIQHLYTPGAITSTIGDTLYVQLLEATLPARRSLVWNASADRQVTIIYKVQNTSDLPLAEGIVRSYQDGLFIGSDFVELTPVGSEGSITVGNLQDVRVMRDESRSAIEAPINYLDTLVEVTLTISNFTDEAVTLDVVDRWNQRGEAYQFSEEPQRERGNILRWTITVPAGETVIISYEYQTD